MLRFALLAVAFALASPGLGVAAEKPSPGSLGFDSSRSAATPPGFGPVSARQKKPAGSDRDRRYARGLFDKYDANGDRVLQEEEWRKIRGKPERADADGDGRITLDELVARVGKRRAERATKRLNDALEAKTEEGRRSHRLRNASDKLPDGLPGWFDDRDRNGDGQVAMHEYSRSWSDATAARFTRLDTNDDGLISPEEAKQ